MRKLIILAAMLAMVLAAAAPAFAHANADASIDSKNSVLAEDSAVAFNDSDQVLNQAVNQYNDQNADVNGDDNNVAQDNDQSVTNEQSQFSASAAFDYDDLYYYWIF